MIQEGSSKLASVPSGGGGAPAAAAAGGAPAAGGDAAPAEEEKKEEPAEESDEDVIFLLLLSPCTNCCRWVSDCSIRRSEAASSFSFYSRIENIKVPKMYSPFDICILFSFRGSNISFLHPHIANYTWNIKN